MEFDCKFIHIEVVISYVLYESLFVKNVCIIIKRVSRIFSSHKKLSSTLYVIIDSVFYDIKI